MLSAERLSLPCDIFGLTGTLMAVQRAASAARMTAAKILMLVAKYGTSGEIRGVELLL